MADQHHFHRRQFFVDHPFAGHGLGREHQIQAAATVELVQRRGHFNVKLEFKVRLLFFQPAYERDQPAVRDRLNGPEPQRDRCLAQAAQFALEPVLEG